MYYRVNTNIKVLLCELHWIDLTLKISKRFGMEENLIQDQVQRNYILFVFTLYPNIIMKIIKFCEQKRTSAARFRRGTQNKVKLT